jgi:vancomycin resistance protein YoaR
MTKKILTKTSKNESILNKEITAVIVTILILLLTALVVGLAFLEYSRAFYKDKSAPSQFFNSVNISGLNSIQTQKQLKYVLNQHIKEKVTFQHKDLTIELSYNDLGAVAEFNPNFNKIKFYSGKPSRLELLKDQFNAKRYTPRLSLDATDLEDNLVGSIPDLAPPKSAHFYWNQLALEIAPETIGNNTNFDQLRVDILTGKKNLEIPVKIKYPSVVTSDIEPLQDSFVRLISAPIKFTYKDKSFEYLLGEKPEKIIFDKDSEGQLTVNIDQELIFDFIAQELKPAISLEPEVLEINYENGRAQFSGIGKSGIEINKQELIEKVNNYLVFELFEENPVGLSRNIAINTEEIPPKLVVAPELQKRGIKELVSHGYTTYHGSPPNRIHNIIVGSNTYNGLIIPQGETFSFNNNLGPVNAAAGYKQELVIKAEGTIPEFGGGICQVSTTIYRGALFAGLDITQRYNHSYTVSYYSQVLGHGLDATIYPGSKDLQFVNDTPSDLVMQVFTEGTTMTVRFFGTSDSRQVELIGPKILSQTPAGPAIYQVNADLPAGTVRQVDKPVNGLTTEWKRLITRPNGEVQEEIITSRFRAVPPKYIVSADQYNN